MRLEVIRLDGDLASLEAIPSGRHLVTVRICFSGVETPLIDTINPLDTKHRARLLSVIVGDDHREDAQKLLLRLADQAFTAYQNSPATPDAASEREIPEESRWATTEPWPQPVDGRSLLEGVAAAFRRFLVLPKPEYYDTIALWVLFTHAHDIFDFSPLLIATSPERASGKSRLLEILELIVPKPWLVLIPSNAVLYRVVDKHHPAFPRHSPRPPGHNTLHRGR